MRYYPIHLDVRDRKCLVVGGGSVGTRKVIGLLECGAKVSVISPVATEKLNEMVAADTISLKKRPYRPSDLQGMFLVIGATDNETLNRKIHADAEGSNLLCNIADRPAICNFILPAIIQRGDFVMTVSTAGKSPAFAKTIRQQLESQFGDEYGDLLALMGAIREKLLAEAHQPEEHKPLFEKLIAGDLLTLVKDKHHAQIDQLLEEVLGPGYRYSQLMTSNRSTGE